MSELPLYKQTITTRQLSALLDAERQRCANIIDIMCNPDTCTSIVNYYINIAAVVCESELRKSPLLSKSGHVAQIGEEMADCRLYLAVERFFIERHLQISNKIAEINDEQNRYDSITAAQEKQLDMLCVSLSQVQKLTDFSVSFTIANDDEKLKPFLQAVFFLFLTHCHSLREVTCARRSKQRLSQHAAFARSFGTADFFAQLMPLTQQYIAFDIDEARYLHLIRTLLRTGTTLDN